MKNESNWDKTAQFTNKGSFSERLAGYFMFYLPMVFFLIIFMTISGSEKLSVFLPNNNLGALVELSVVLFPPLFPLILWERSIRKSRRKNGFSVYGNIREELEQREINERVAKEHKAFVANGLVKGGESVDKSDIGYWFGLLKDGAITQEEYDRKKAELM